jgi:hypothetical protein
LRRRPHARRIGATTATLWAIVVILAALVLLRAL